MHDHGNQGNFFDRVDLKPSQADTINVNFGFTRSWFQTPNSFDAKTPLPGPGWWPIMRRPSPTPAEIVRPAFPRSALSNVAPSGARL